MVSSVSLIFSLLCLLIWHTESASNNCPLNFTILSGFPDAAIKAKHGNLTVKCLGAKQGLHLVLAEYLRTEGLFLPPANASASCWSAFQNEISSQDPSFDVRNSCGFDSSSLTQKCMNITTQQDFENQVPLSSRQNLKKACNQNLSSSPCAQCTAALTSTQAIYLPGSSGNLTDCSAYSSIYAAAILNKAGPTDTTTAWCLFFIGLNSAHKKSYAWVYGAVAAGVSVCVLGCVVGFLYWRRRRARMEKKKVLAEFEASDPCPLNPNSTLVRFTIEDIRAATKNFSRENIVGTGGYGNVYKGDLADGSLVAVKRFKNCSPAGDPEFVHEIDVISSIRHRNLVGLRGFCVAPGSLEGHQRILVCEFVPNWSLHDHLFDHRRSERRLNWPIRCQIAIGTARGLAYLHHEIQPAIIHRDIKASNILLDENFNARVADFGLAKFSPEGVSHLSTRVAGTLGYVAPEYALYGQLTEKSDVYSFGVVLLELLSGRKALITNAQSHSLHITDWAWSLVRTGNTLEVIEQGMENPGTAEVMERYVLIALICAHPQMFCRPSMDQVLKMMESDLPVPHIPDRPIPLIAELVDIERSAVSSGSGQFSSPSGFQSFSSEMGLAR